jgi:membrane fusion protein, multidrug efflux system
MTMPIGWPLSAAAGLTLALGLALAACQDDASVLPPVRPVLFVDTVVKTSEMIGPFAGSIEPRYTASVGFRIFGRLVARDVNIGDLVKKGSRVAAVDPAVQEIAVRSAEAAVASALAQLTNATATEARQGTLLERNVTPAAQFEIAQKNRATAAASLAQAKANLTKARDELAYTQLYADVDGVVTGRNAEVGQVVTAGQPVLTIARPDVKEAVFDVPDALATALPTDAVFNVVLELEPSVGTSGRVREIAPEADQATRTRRVRLSLDRPPDTFRLGTTITVTRTTPVAPRIDLPATAVLDEGDRTFVWVVDQASRKVDRREVTIAIRADRSIGVTGGLSPGERIVIAGAHSLKAGQVVKILDEASR